MFSKVIWHLPLISPLWNLTIHTILKKKISNNFTFFYLECCKQVVHNNYRHALRHLLPSFPFRIQRPVELIDKLYSDEVLESYERKKILHKYDNEGSQVAIRMLIDVMLEKSDDKIMHFMLILKNMPEESNVADAIQQEADKWKAKCLQNIFTPKEIASSISMLHNKYVSLCFFFFLIFILSINVIKFYFGLMLSEW